MFKPPEDRINEGSVRMRLQQGRETGNVDRSDDLEKMWIVGEGVDGVLFGGDFDATRVGGPNGIWLWLESYRLGVRHAITELSRFTARQNARIGIKRLNGKLIAAKLLERGAIAVVLLLCPLCRGLAIDLAILLPAREQDPADNDDRD